MVLSLAVCITAFPQASKSQKTKTESAPETPAEPPQDIDTLKIDTNLVTVPVIASDPSGAYVADLAREEFKLVEDGVPHEIAFFATVTAPFHVVLMLDTSASTREKLRTIQESANAFVQQLQPADRVKIISFDDKVKDHNEFTSNRDLLTSAIYKTRPGQGTKVYDAVQLALNVIRPIRGRKAIVIFSDGVDFHSDSATFENTLRGLDEEGVIVYPIRYDTREETERIAREQAAGGGPQLPTSDVIRRPAPGTTPPTFPGEDPGSYPPRDESTRTGPFGLPSPDEILRRKRESDRRREQERYPGRYPDRYPDPGDVRRDTRSPVPPITTDGRTTGRDDSIDSMLDLLYLKADSYLQNLADKSGGKLLRADVLTSLPEAFANIAAELRTQYLLGYYPIKKERDEKYRKIKVTTTRKNVRLRSRPGYLATASSRSATR